VRFARPPSLRSGKSLTLGWSTCWRPWPTTPTLGSGRSPAPIRKARSEASRHRSIGAHARDRQGEEDATLRASPADVRAERMSEARPRSAAEDQPTLDRRTPQILIWGMGGAAAILPAATAARGACTERNASSWRVSQTLPARSALRRCSAIASTSSSTPSPFTATVRITRGRHSWRSRIVASAPG